MPASLVAAYRGPAATAAARGTGVGGGKLKQSASDLTGLNNAQLDTSNTTWTVRGGWRFHPNFAAELGYYDLGRYDFSGTAGAVNVPVNGSGRAQSVGASLVVIWPIYQVDVYGRVGYAHSEIKLNGNAPAGTLNQNYRQNEATYGAGVRWNFHPNWGLFAEWIKNDGIKVDSYVGGIDYRF